MLPESPYSPPKSMNRDVQPSIILWIIGSIFGCICAGSLFGLVLGVVIGKFAPDYYRAVFSRTTATNFDPVSVGIGLGITEGAVAGAVIGVVSVLIFLWYRTR